MLCTRREKTASADQENLLKKDLDLLQGGSLYVGRSLINIREVLILALSITSATPQSISSYVPSVQELCRQIQSLHVSDLISSFCDKIFDPSPTHPTSLWPFGSHFLSILCLYHRPLRILQFFLTCSKTAILIFRSILYSNNYRVSSFWIDLCPNLSKSVYIKRNLVYWKKIKEYRTR